MRWKGRENFIERLAEAGYEANRGGLEALAKAMGELMVKPPTWASLRTVCLSPKGFKRAETIEALCRALRCELDDLYEARPQEHLSFWDRIKAGGLVADRESWPVRG